MRHVHRTLGMRERQVSLLREQQVVVELLRELLVEPERFLVEGDTLRRAVVRAHDRGVAAAAPGADVVRLQHRHVLDASLRELVRDGQPVGAAADDHDVVGGLAARSGATCATAGSSGSGASAAPPLLAERVPADGPPPRRSTTSRIDRHAYRANSMATQISTTGSEVSRRRTIARTSAIGAPVASPGSSPAGSHDVSRASASDSDGTGEREPRVEVGHVGHHRGGPDRPSASPSTRSCRHGPGGGEHHRPILRDPRDPVVGPAVSAGSSISPRTSIFAAPVTSARPTVPERIARSASVSP